MQASGSWRGISQKARCWFLRSIQICRICISDRVSLVKVRQNLFISGDMDPGSVPQAQPLMPIMRAYSTTQKYLNSGRQPFLTRLWQVISMARAMRNSPKLCRVFFSRNSTETNPPTNPASSGMYFCRYYATHRRSTHRIDRKMHTNEPTKSPNFMASRPKNTAKRWLGFFTMRLIEKRVESPALMRQLKAAILALSLRMALAQGPECLQKGLLPSLAALPSFYITDELYLCDQQPVSDAKNAWF